MFTSTIRCIPACIIVVITILAGCATTAQPEPPTPTLPSMPTMLVATTTAEPTTLPVSTPAASSLVGPEWQIALEGDLNQDGRRDVVAYKASAIMSDASMQSYTQELPFTISEAVIVQEGAQGMPQIQATVSVQGVYAENIALIPAESFGESRPSAFLMGIDPQAEVPMNFIPLNASGEGYAQGFGLYWNEGQLAYRLFVNGQAVPPPNTPPGSTLPLSTPHQKEPLLL